MSERSKKTETLRTVLDRIREGAKKIPGRPYNPSNDPALQPETLALPLPPADAPPPPASHHDREPGDEAP